MESLLYYCTQMLNLRILSKKKKKILSISTYRVNIKSFPDYKHLLQENYCTWNTNFYFKCHPRSFFTTHQYTSTCAPFVARRTANRLSISLHCVLQHVFSYCSKSVCYSCLQICNIWNWCRKHFVLNIPP